MSAFDGVWRLDVAASSAWDSAKGAYVPDDVGEEIIRISHHGGVQEYEVLYGDSPQILMGYSCPFDGTEWADYTVRAIGNVQGDVAAAVDAFRERIHASSGAMRREFEVGKRYNLVRLVSGDERTHYRLGGDPATGLVLSNMMRRMEPDGDAYVAYVFDVDGVVNRVRRFVRADDSAFVVYD